MTFSRLSILVASVFAVSQAQAAFYTYHGELMDGDAPADGAYDLRVRSFAQPDARTALGEATELPAVAVAEGRFNVELDLPEDADGVTWVQVAVRKAGSDDSYAVLGDPQPVAKVNSTCPGAWALDGNSGRPPGSYLGSADFTPLELRINGSRTALFTPGGAVNSLGSAPTITLGSSANLATGSGATVAGGGASLDYNGNPTTSFRNEANSDFATVSGGVGNKANASWASIGGGQTNAVDGNYGVVAGGRNNKALGLASVVSGGDGNRVEGSRGVVAGGDGNISAGSSSIVAGGSSNLAGANRSFAGGAYARVRMPGLPPATLPPNVFVEDYTGLVGGDEGSFVWSNGDTVSYFRSSGRNQFLVRAPGGVGINTATLAGAALTVAQPNPANSGNSIVLRTSTRTSEWRIDEPSGDSYLTSTQGDLLLTTGAAGKYIRTNDRFGVHRRPTANDLEVEGDASKSTAGSWLANSDRRIKANIAPIPHALDTILRVRPVTFEYDAAYRAAHKGVGTGRFYNVIAQEFAAVFPDAVKRSGEFLPNKARTPDNEILQVDTYPAQITAIAAIQELAVQDDALRDELARVQAENTALRERLDALALRMERLDAHREP